MKKAEKIQFKQFNLNFPICNLQELEDLVNICYTVYENFNNIIVVILLY